MSVSAIHVPPRQHKKQLAFHQSLCKSRFVFGGNRTGKSIYGAVETIWYATGLHPFIKIERACDGWAVSLTRQVQWDVAQAKILQYLPPEWIVKTVHGFGQCLCTSPWRHRFYFSQECFWHAE